VIRSFRVPQSSFLIYPSSMTIDDLRDALSDLQHDLGKHLAWPLAMLPADASDADRREALRCALIETRTGPSGTRPAAAIWRSFLDEVGDALMVRPEWCALVDAVEGALTWADHLDRADLAEATRDLAAVAPAIRRLAGALEAS
jgi:hypothetical protein